MTRPFTRWETGAPIDLLKYVGSKSVARPDNFVSGLLVELIGGLKLGNVWVFVQLIFGPCWPKTQLNKNSNIA